MKNRAQISLEFALLLATVLAVASIVGFYYIKSIAQGSAHYKETTLKSEAVTQTEAMKRAERVKQLME
ncbi:hypothetical protein J422_01905 [Methanocaldococcus villosus KIN24-T80]|uniref:Class III signal peptide-containing protein n=1 Tax=Methanocaldococcus villosus KIN24-T80 TaxID=1069083 RepID=N6V2Q1_9EURY|nr:class III signal peptide domain-containing protein, archaeosortase D/PIP-CTERM system-associated [Methanocaldococcus villosus]ENN96528.1 hypothetical protein J422_01905 [Methanocaldococcus villosus KIN24-T80]